MALTLGPSGLDAPTPPPPTAMAPALIILSPIAASIRGRRGSRKRPSKSGSGGCCHPALCHQTKTGPSIQPQSFEHETHLAAREASL